MPFFFLYFWAISTQLRACYVTWLERRIFAHVTLPSRIPFRVILAVLRVIYIEFLIFRSRVCTYVLMFADYGNDATFRAAVLNAPQPWAYLHLARNISIYQNLHILHLFNIQSQRESWKVFKNHGKHININIKIYYYYNIKMYGIIVII